MNENKLTSNIRNFFKGQITNTKVYLIFRSMDNDTSEYIYRSLFFGFNDKDYKKFIEEYKDKLLALGKNKEIVPYDISVTEKDTIEMIDSEDVPDLLKVKEKLTPSESKMISSEKDFKPIEIWGYGIVIKNDNNETIRTYRKQVNAKLLQENKVVSFGGGEVKIVESDKRLILDFKIDAIEINDICYVVNDYYFNQFFSFTEAHVHYAKENVGELKKINIIENFNDFQERCLKSNTLVKRLISVIKEDRLNWLKENFQAAKKVSQEYKLKIEFDDENNKIIYSDKNCNISDVITLIRGGCVMDAVDMERYIASSVRKVNAI